MVISSPRKRNRLPDYDYSAPGWYYITICTFKLQCWFGKIENGKVRLNEVGEMIRTWWLKVPERFYGTKIDCYQIMPNHIHAIVIYSPESGRTHWSAPTNKKNVGTDQCVCPQKDDFNLSKVIQWFKTMTTNRYISKVKNSRWKPFEGKLWQRSFYDHIIRNEKSLYKIRTYISNNPINWSIDRNNPDS
jgi:putative transposase